MFGFSLFLVMFTIGFKVNTITKDKASGVWNRLILSPSENRDVYGSSAIQLCDRHRADHPGALIFRYGFGFDLGDQYGLR